MTGFGYSPGRFGSGPWHREDVLDPLFSEAEPIFYASETGLLITKSMVTGSWKDQWKDA